MLWLVERGGCVGRGCEGPSEGPVGNLRRPSSAPVKMRCVRKVWTVPGSDGEDTNQCGADWQGKRSICARAVFKIFKPHQLSTDRNKTWWTQQRRTVSELAKNRSVIANRFCANRKTGKLGDNKIRLLVKYRSYEWIIDQ